MKYQIKFHSCVFIFLILFFSAGCGQSGSISAVTSSAEGDQDFPLPPPVTGFRPVVESIQSSGQSAKVDLLVVMDNSRSMEYEQLSISNRFSSFIDQLVNIDWQLAIITTDVLGDAQMKDGRFIRFTNTDKFFLSSKDDINASKRIFSETIRIGSNGDTDEQAIKATYRALERSLNARDDNRLFIRDDAALAVIIVSDADETLPFNQPATFKNDPSRLLSFIESNWPQKKVRFHSIIVKDGDESCLRDPNDINEGYGLTYARLSQMTGGIVGSVCEQDYGRQLSSIGNSTQALIKEYTLKCAPQDTDNDGVVNLVVENLTTGVQIKNFKVQSNTIIFDKPLESGNFKVEYYCK